MRPKRHPLLAFYIIAAVFYMATSFAHPVTPALIKRLALEDYMFGLALAAMMTTNFLFSPFWGKLSGYIGNRFTLLIGCVGYGVGQVFFVMAQSRAQFLLARLFTGIFVGAAFVSLLIHVSAGVEDERRRGQQLVTLATLQAVFGSMGYFVGGMLGEIDINLSVVVQAVTLVASGIAFFLLPATPESPPMQPRPDGLRPMLREANPFRAFAQGRQFLTAAFVLLFAICALQSLSQTAFDQSFNYYVIDQVGLSTGYNGMIKAVMGIVTLIANGTLCTWLIRRTDIRRSITWVLLAATLAMAAVLSIRVLAPFLAAGVVFYALSAICVPLTQNLVVSAETDADRSLVMGFYNALKSFGGIVGALVAGFAYAVSPLAPFVCCTAALGVATVCSLLYRRRAPAK